MTGDAQRAKNLAVVAAEFRAECHMLEDEVAQLKEALNGIWRIAVAAEACASRVDDPAMAWRQAVRHIRSAAEKAIDP